MPKYTPEAAIRSLSAKHDCRVDEKTRTISILNGKDPKHPKRHDLGNGSWGRIDYLVNYSFYKKRFVSFF